jgi:hypothetical protein
MELVTMDIVVVVIVIIIKRFVNHAPGSTELPYCLQANTLGLVIQGVHVNKCRPHHIIMILFSNPSFNITYPPVCDCSTPRQKASFASKMKHVWVISCMHSTCLAHLVL